MTPKQLANLRPVKKGQVLNPKGINANPVIQRLRRLTQFELEQIMTLILDNNADALEKIQKSKKESALKQMLAAVALQGINTGDEKKTNMFLDRLVGKPKEKVEVSGAEGGPIVTANMTPEERKAMLAQIDLKLRNTEDE